MHGLMEVMWRLLSIKLTDGISLAVAGGLLHKTSGVLTVSKSHIFLAIRMLIFSVFKNIISEDSVQIIEWPFERWTDIIRSNWYYTRSLKIQTKETTIINLVVKGKIQVRVYKSYLRGSDSDMCGYKTLKGSKTSTDNIWQKKND